MSESKGHAEGIKKSIEEIIGSNTVLKSKRPSEEDAQRERFEKVITALEAIEIKTIILNSDFKIDLSDYNENFYTAIDAMLMMHFGKEACELIFFYLYDRIAPDGSVNELVDENGNSVILASPTDLWFLIKQIQGNKKKK
jgi:hypothetical protein